MPERNNDQLENFFRKATSRPDVPFNEDDWKKLEARLDAEPTSWWTSGRVVKVAASALIAAAVLFSGGFWLNSRYQIVERVPQEATVTENAVESPIAKEDGAVLPQAGITGSEDINGNINSNDSDNQARDQKADDRIAQAPANAMPGEVPTANDDPVEAKRQYADHLTDRNNPDRLAINNEAEGGERTGGNGQEARQESKAESFADAREPVLKQAEEKSFSGITALHEEKISNDLVSIPSTKTVKIKQKAVVDLPGAEEVDSREAAAIVKEEHASVQRQQWDAPGLSLLLSFAPDFSSTSFDEYSGPGKAFGAMLRYRTKGRWAISTGVLKNHKQYSSSGEYYEPPSGYWIRNTNGIVPSTIDGSCNVLEFPLMIQYALPTRGSNGWFVGVGTSSYLMQSESYQYFFEQPNPGAKDGWHSRGSSRFLFNMVNFTVGFERQVLPGLMAGVEPYIKLPIEKIGWSNLKLFSTGVSVTLRYNLLSGQTFHGVGNSRPPD